MKNNLYSLILCLIIFLCCFFIVHIFIDYFIEFPSETLRNVMEQQEQDKFMQEQRLNDGGK